MLQSRDIEIVRQVYENRLLRSDQIAALAQKDGVKLKTNQVILDRLRVLYDKGLLDRIAEDPGRRKNKEGSERIVYGLASGGADLLAEEFGIDRGKIQWSKKNREVKRKYIKHALMISQFRTALTLALRTREDVRLLYWRQGKEIRDKVEVLIDKEKKIRYPVWPDGFFCLQVPRGNLNFFFEADQSTMAGARVVKKMKGYWEYWRQKKHTKKYGTKYFRVLTITISEARKDNLRKETKKADPKGKGSPMFMFACEKSYSLKEPQNILEAIWQTPEGEEWQSLLG